MSKLNARETERLIMALERVLKEICDVTDVHIILGIDNLDDYLTEGVEDEISLCGTERTIDGL